MGSILNPELRNTVGKVSVGKFANYVVITSVLAMSIFSLGISGSFNLSVSVPIIVAIALVAIVVTGRLRIDGTIYAAAFYLFAISLATLLALDHGAQLGSFLRGGVWFMVFLALYDSFCRCDYSKVVKYLLIYSSILAVIHLIQMGQVYFEIEPFRVVPDSWHVSGGVRWDESRAAPRPAVIFTEVSWYAFYQVIILSLTLIWAQTKLTRAMKIQIGLIFISVLWSGSLTGIVLSFAILAVWIVKQKRLGGWQLSALLLMVIVLAGFLVFSAAGQMTIGRFFINAEATSINGRIFYPWIRVASVMAQWPLEGVGLGNEANAGMGTVPVLGGVINNLYAYFLAATGLIGFGGLLGFLVFIGRKHLIELLFFLLLGFANSSGLGENFWIPVLLWAGSITNREMALRRSVAGVSAPDDSGNFAPVRIQRGS